MENQGQDISVQEHVKHDTSSLDGPAAKRLKLEGSDTQNGEPEPGTKKREKVRGIALIKEE
jgi:hypothetical protein